MPGTFGSKFDLIINGVNKGVVSLEVGGRHNVLNSLGAIAAAVESEIDIEDVISGLSQFSLPDRRFQILYRSSSLLVVDDYAHQPTEIRVTLDTLLHEGFGRVIVVFQPHRYTRLENLMEEFAGSFDGADIIVIAELYGANQVEIEGVNSGVLAELIREKTSGKVIYIGDMDELTSYLRDEVENGDAVAFLSAGDLTRTAHAFAEMVE